MRRRNFLRLCGALWLGPFWSLRAATKKLGIPLGLDSYSLRAWRWNVFQLLDFCSELQLDGLMVAIPRDFESLEPGYLAKVRQRAQELGIQLDAAIGCISPTSNSWNPKLGKPEDVISQGLLVAQAIGARSLRAFVGAPGMRPVGPHVESTLRVLRNCRARIQDAGLKIAIENHGEFLAGELRQLIEAAGKDIAACCLDTGNPLHVMEDPLFTLEVLAPYTVTSHVRDSVVFSHPRGAAFQWVALGDGSIGFERLAQRFAQLCPGVPMHLEIITGRPPTVVPLLEEEHWKLFPEKPARELTGFLRLVRDGHPYLGPMVVEDISGPIPDEYRAALKLQQRLDVERSIRYAREHLGLGLKA